MAKRVSSNTAQTPARQTPRSTPRRVVRTIRKSNHYLKIFLMGTFIFLLGVFTAYRFFQRVPVSGPIHDLPSSQIVMNASPTPEATLTELPSSTVVNSVQANGSTLVTPVTHPMTYMVKVGDTLWSIAQQQAGDPYQWSRIYQLNRAELGRNPDHIEPGMVLILPS